MRLLLVLAAATCLTFGLVAPFVGSMHAKRYHFVAVDIALNEERYPDVKERRKKAYQALDTSEERIQAMASWCQLLGLGSGIGFLITAAYVGRLQFPFPDKEDAP